MTKIQNGYGETVTIFQVGDRVMYQSARFPDLAPYEVTLFAVYAEYFKGNPAYLMHTEPSGDHSGWQPFDCYSEIT